LLRVVLHRIQGRPGLAALSVLAIALAIGLATSVPIFAQAVNRAILEEELGRLETDLRRSPLTVKAYYLPASTDPFTAEQALSSLVFMQGIYQRNTDLPVTQQQVAISSSGLLLKTQQPGSYGPAGTFLANASVGFLSDIEQHIAVVDGDAWGAPSTGARLNVWMHESFATELGLHAGEAYDLQPISSPATIAIRIAGLWAPSDAADPYWPASPNSTYRSLLLVHGDEYTALVQPLLGTMPTASVHWSLHLDEARFVPELARRYIEGLSRADVEVHQMLPDAKLDVAALPALQGYLERLRPLTLLLFGFSVPIIGFVLYFVAVVSAIAADSERQVVAVLVSRGASDAQVTLLALIEGGLLLLLGTPIGIALGLGIGRLMGYTTSFLRFGAMSPLDVSLAGLNGWLIALTMLVSLLARVYPTLTTRGQGVIAHAREVGRQLKPPFWQRYYVDLILILPTYYLLRQLALAGSISIGKWRSSGDLFSDPMVFLVPAFFIMTCALLAARLVPLLLRLLDRAFSGLLPVTPALTLQQLGRRGGVYTNALLLIMTMMAVGVFVASMAVSLDDWLADRIAYRIGADLAFRVDEGPSNITAGASTLDEGGYVEQIDPGRWLVPLEDLEAIPGVRAATWTGRYRAHIPVDPTKVDRGWFLAIDRQSFPGAAAFRPDFAGDSLGMLMNRLAIHSNGALVSEGYLERTGMQVGDPLRIWVSTDGANSIELNLLIVGSYRLFPTVYEGQYAADDVAARLKRSDEERDTVVGNLDYIMSMGGGVATYNVWLRADPDADLLTLRRGISEVAPYTADHLDVWTLTTEEIERKERVGVYGVLTSGFIASLLLAAMGLLIQHRRSLEDRLWRFAALRALGLSQQQVVAQVQLEYLTVLVLGLAAGGAIGVAAARIFVPFFRVTTAEGVLPLPPLRPQLDIASMWVMAGAFALVQIVIQGGLLHRALRSDLFQVLRMGARE
jgi:putative ABC transport system permease protein